MIRQKGESKNGGSKKQSTPNFFLKNEHFLPPDIHTSFITLNKPAALSKYV